RLAHRVPGEVAARREVQALLGAGGQAAATAAALLGLADRAHHLVADRGGLVAHGAREALDDEARPGEIRAVVLPDLEVHAIARVLDRLDAAGAHRLRDGIEGRAVVLRGRGER